MKYYILNLAIEIGDGYEFSCTEYIPIHIYKDRNAAVFAIPKKEDNLQYLVSELIALPLDKKLWVDFLKRGPRTKENVEKAEKAYKEYCVNLTSQKIAIFKKYNFPYCHDIDIERLGEATFVITECDGD